LLREIQRNHPPEIPARFKQHRTGVAGQAFRLALGCKTAIEGRPEKR